MFLKVMSNQNASDKDQSKGYTLTECVDITFCVSETQGPIAEVCLVDGKSINIPVPGNAYVLNTEGKTIDCWAPNSDGPVKHLLTEGVDPMLLKTPL